MVLAHNIDEGIRTRDIHISQDVTFDTMLLASNTLKGLKKSGFYKPSPVQLHGIPLGKCGFDLLLEAKSGTGKTAVFSVIALEKLELEKGLQVIILAPTREIASQICDVIKKIGENYNGLVVEVVMGGLPVAEDVEKFKKNVHIVVGSPGRLRHLIQDKHINVCTVRLLVLDEADKLMEKSFLTDINYIFSILPSQKQVIMSSATYPETTKTFINKYVKCAQHVCPDSNCILLGVEQKITIVRSNTNIVRQTQYRFEELLKILSHKQFKQCLIFCNYQARVTELFKLLMREKWPVEQLCGQLDQSDRLDALKTLQEYKCRILISTDLAARGIDASNVDLVINFEPPFEWQTYLHRIGRAGRYGSYGMAITILGEGKEENGFKKMLELIKDSLSITHFWETYKTNEIQQNNVPQPDNIPNNNFVSTTFERKYKDFWKILVNDSVTEEEIDNFEILCKSFENSKQTTIESFTDLINSYKTNNISNRDIGNYQYINLNKPEIIKPIFQSLESNDDLNGAKNKTNKENFMRAGNDMSTACYDFKEMQLEKNTSHDISDRKKLYMNDFKNYFDDADNIEAESSSRALLNAGLPLSFGCSKKNRTDKAKATIGKEERFKDVSSKTLKTNYKEGLANNSREINYKNTNTSQHIVKRTFNHKDNRNKEIRKNVCNNGTEASFTKSSMINVCDNYNQHYINWYKQLRARVKYFELAVYINEISRLQI